jgi:hypothetical protein
MFWRSWNKDLCGRNGLCALGLRLVLSICTPGNLYVDLSTRSGGLYSYNATFNYNRNLQNWIQFNDVVCKNLPLKSKKKRFFTSA